MNRPLQYVAAYTAMIPSLTTPKSNTDKALQDLRTMVVKRDNEIARLREQRDQQLSELNERRQKDSVKQHSLNEYKTLAETRSVSLSLICFRNLY